MVDAQRDGGWRLSTAWRWMLLFILAALLLSQWVPTRLAVGDEVPLDDDVSVWVLSSDMNGARKDGLNRWMGQGAGPHTASRLVDVDSDVEFLRLEACTAKAIPDDGVGLYLASVYRGALDFNRQFFLRGDAGAAAGECFADALPRRRDDGLAVLQLQIADPGVEVALTRLTMTPLIENPLWQVLRLIMLALGLCLLSWCFAPCVGRKPRTATFLGLVTVAGIVFGCCVSVALKADIYALLTGGDELRVAPSTAEMLLQVFPSAGSSLFTKMHALLFAAATFFLCLGHRRAWLDMLLLGVSTEVLQIFVPGRGPGLSDVVVDWVGVGAALTLLVAFRRGQRIGLFLKNKRVDEDTARL